MCKAAYGDDICAEREGLKVGLNSIENFSEQQKYSRPPIKKYDTAGKPSRALTGDLQFKLTYNLLCH